MAYMKGKADKEKHEFALFVPSLSSLVHQKDVGNSIVLSDETVVHRIATVLRLRPSDQCIFFDRDIQAIVEIMGFVGKKQIQVKIESVQKNLVLQPSVTFLLPMLKRDDYAAALYALTEVGVSTIQLIFTHKTPHQWSRDKDNERAQRIIISAAEQSKNFTYPQLQEPITLEAALQKYNAASVKFFFDPEGKHLFDVMNALHNDQPKDILLLIGPEGDLNSEEKRMVQVNQFIFCALTPTVIRAVQAATLGAGFVRSLLSSNHI